MNSTEGKNGMAPDRAKADRRHSGERKGKALVTGGAGFIGSHLCESLLDEGWEVYALDDLSTSSMRNVAHLKERWDFHLVVDSVLSASVLNELVYKCDVVFHLAAAVGVKLIVERPVHTLVTNVQGTETVLEYCNRFDKRVLIASTDSKAMDEFLALAYQQERGLDCVIARLFNTVGPRQSGQYGMVIPRFVERAVAGAPLEIHGDGTQTRCFCHVADTIRALTGLMDAQHTSGQIYNVGSPQPISVLDLAKRVMEMTRSSSELTFIPYEQVYGQGIQDMLHRMPAVEKIREAIGWEPSLELDLILADVIKHIRTAPVPLPERDLASAP